MFKDRGDIVLSSDLNVVKGAQPGWLESVNVDEHKRKEQTHLDITPSSHLKPPSVDSALENDNIKHDQQK